jgi:hypothetical protein
MKFKFLRLTLILCAGLLILQALYSARPAVRVAGQDSPPLAPEALADESWRYGITVETTPPAYSSLVGRLLAESAAFRSARAADIYFIFPAPATAKTVYQARIYILSRSGTYTGNALLSLQVYNFAGVLQHTVSAASVDLETAAAGSWQSIGLSATAANLVISPGEFLAFHFHLSAAAGNNLDVRPIFEVLLH